MAKVKQTKTVQELLQEAIIPNNQAPFSIPDNWCWVKLGELSSIKTGKHDANHAKENGHYRFYTCSANYTYCDTYMFEGEAVIVPGNGDIGLVFYYDGKFDAYQRTYVISKFNGSTKYLYYYFYYMWKEKNEDKLFGTAIPYVRLANLTDFEIPIAPSEEQQRIVDKIGALFSKLDEAKELIQKSLDEFENRKAAILHKAFNNEINSGGLYSSNWKRGTLRDVVLNIKYGTSEKSDYNFTGIPVVRIPNIINNQVNTCDIKYLQTSNFDNVDELADGDILIIRSNGSRDLVGQCALVEGLIGYTYASFLIRIRLKEGFEPKYVVYYLNSNAARGQLFSKAKSSAGIHNINSKEILSITIKYPPVEEQQEIVRILDSFFEKEDKSNELLDMIDQIEEMKKSILSRAFRGELGTHSDDDEPAIELLKKII